MLKIDPKMATPNAPPIGEWSVEPLDDTIENLTWKRGGDILQPHLPMVAVGGVREKPD